MTTYYEILHHVPVTATSVDTALWHIERELMDRYGTDTAAREIAPLRWYIDTGRASTEFLYRLINKSKPFMVARKLHAGGTDEEIIKRIKSYLGIE